MKQTYLIKPLRFIKGYIRDLIIRCVRYSPITSKYIGSPKGYYASSKEYWNFCETNNQNKVSYSSFLPDSVSKRNPPKSIYETIHWKFDGRYLHENPETFVISIPNGRVFGSFGAIITHNDKLILDVSLQMMIGTDVSKVKYHHVFYYLKFPKCQQVPENVAVLATCAGEGYFHWLTDVLPRIEILRKTLSNGDEDIDKYVVNKGLPIMEESLKMLGVPIDRLIYADSNLHIEAKNLVVPSLPGSTGHPPSWVCNFLRENFLKLKADIPPITKLYVSRSKASRRRVANEEDVLECLGKFGFTPVWLEEHNFATQIALFSNAEFIVGPHGAGLTNLIWCNPNAKVLEFFSPNYVNICFWAIANQMSLEYFYIIGSGEKPPEYSDPDSLYEDIDVPIEELKQSLELLLKPKIVN